MLINVIPDHSCHIEVYFDFSNFFVGNLMQKDSLMEISFHIPTNNTQFVGDENRPPAQVRLFRFSSHWFARQVAPHTCFQVFREKIMSMADVGAGGEEAVVTFEGIAILTPRWVICMIVIRVTG